MRVLIDGLSGDVEEHARDHLAGAVAASLQKLRLLSRLESVCFNFETAGEKRIGNAVPSSLPASAGAVGRRTKEQEHEAIQLDRLLTAPARTSRNLRLSGSTGEALEAAIARFEKRQLVYETWGIAEIDAIPRLALNFAGPPGTGKTMSAHYLADRLRKNIIEVSYADVVSKYFGEAARNLSALFSFAKENDAVLFIDEAETLLSKRGESSGSIDHTVNSMRSQLLTLIDRTPILTVFATNLVDSYDQAFLSRLITVPFVLPDMALRVEIWRSHLPKRLPLESGITATALAVAFPRLNGRQIWRIVVEAAHRAAIQRRKAVAIEDFRWASEFVASETNMEGTLADGSKVGQAERSEK